MASINYTVLDKAALDAINGQNVQISFEYYNGKLKYVIIKVLPLTSLIVYRICADRGADLLSWLYG